MRKMKYINGKLVVLAVCLLFTACQDFFNIAPENGADPDGFYNNNNELNSVAYGMYAPIAPEIHKLFLWGSARADLVVGGDTEDTYITEFVNNNVSKLNPHTDYGFLYQSIARCNHQLENLPRMQPNGERITPTSLKIFYGEAHFLRAWCYFQLVRTFGEVPLILEDIADEVVFTDDNGKEVKMSTISLTDEELRAVLLKPKSKQDIWASIMSDLAKARVLLNGDSYLLGYGATSTTKLIRANRLAVYALSAEVALWNGLFQDASNFAGVLILQNKLGSETLWNKQYETRAVASAASYNSFGFMYAFSGSFRTHRMQEFTSHVEADGGRYLVKPKITVCSNLFDESLDIRSKTSFMRVDRKDVIWKYIGADDKGKVMIKPYESISNWYLLKHAETVTTKGIAENRLGNIGGALEMLNRVREARGMDKYSETEIPLTMENLENLLFKERARESAFEGKRWYDLLLREEVLGTSGIIAKTVSEKYDDEDLKSEVYNRLINPTSWYLPIEPERWK